MFVSRDPQAGRLTYGQLRELSNQSRQAVFHRLSVYGARLRNTPAFFKQKRHELRAMIQQLGDPHVFATNSHADTQCPYLHRFIVNGASIEPGSDRDPFAPDLDQSTKYRRRLANVVAFPHLVAQYFCLKTELFFTHIGEALGCEAHWCRYEWQSRGSTHAHYFLWLKGTPDLSFLDHWVEEELRSLGQDASLSEEAVQRLVDRLNQRAVSASDWEPAGGWPESADDLLDATDEIRAAHAAHWWARRCGRFSQAWDSDEKKPHMVGDPHPSSEEHLPLALGDAGVELPTAVQEQRQRLLNKLNRHSTHYASYCLRRDQHGKEFCRFGFPHQPRERNDAHFYFELVRNKDGSPKGVRAQLYLPMNDPLMNTVNPEQAASQRANVDFKPLIDHFSALEYATKYATKQEKGSKAFDSMLALALNGGDRAAPESAGRSAIGAFASFLIQSVGGRDWSAQEVAHVNMGYDTVIASHDFLEYSVNEQGKLHSELDWSAADSDFADTKNKFDEYLEHMEAHNLTGGMQMRLNQVGVTGGQLPQAPVDRNEIAECSFSEFWRNYSFISGGRGNGHQIVRRSKPTIVVIKPHLPRFFAKSGHEKRPDYCRMMLRKYKPFQSKEDYNNYIYVQHRGDCEAAYEEFATLDPTAPDVCRDDFRDIIFFDEGTEVVQEGQALIHPDFAAYRVGALFEQATDQIKEQKYDWITHTAERYNQQQVTDAGKWQQLAAMQPRSYDPPSGVDISHLNDGQRRVYDVVVEHAQRWAQQVTQPLHVMVCGTAGSGKTFLIRAIKQQLGGSCLVLAPTGVAADNIGGRTYQSVLPVPRKDIDRADIMPKGKKRIQKMVDDVAGVSHIIIDEMSMVGRRSLGQVDALLQKATGNKALFGGKNIILVGDHGQLPPVKDKHCYDWSGVRYTTAKLHGLNLAHAPMWQRLGIEAYEAFTTVFFLDRIERVSSSDAVGDAFRGLQLRARDGELTEADYQFMKQHMTLAGREDEFQGPETYHLVTTHAKRDERNNQEFEAALAAGKPSISIDALNSGPVALAADEEDMGNLPNVLHLCLGARVMVTRNLCISHGICNGTIGIVHDILVNSTGFVEAVVIKVRRATATQDGYKGPSFPGATEGVDLATEALVAINRRSTDIWTKEGQSEERSQFPLML